MSGQRFFKFKDGQVLLRTGAVMKVKNPPSLVSQIWEKIFPMNTLVACILEMYPF